MLVKASNRRAQGALWCLAATAVLVAAIANAAPPKSPATAWPAAAAPAEEMVSQLMIKPRASTGVKLAGALQRFDASALSLAAAVPLSVVRPMSGGAHVLRLAQPVTLSEARVIAARLMRDSSVELAEPDRIMRAAATIPTDPGYAQQWHYYAPGGANLGGANLPNAWGVTKGSAAVNVAVIDTGYRQHADLGTVLPGYDFITDPATANDGDGRDADAQDPGDWVAAGECGAGEPASKSSWHGTHVAGTIAALMNNNLDGTGVAPNVKILPVRVLGKCGGLMSDVIDGMRWAVGIAVPGAPANANPAQVLNLSLGGGGACPVAMQTAVNDVIGAGKVIVAAAGNDGAATVSTPANCAGVIAVTAHAIDGDNAYYANIGPEVAISAPGGGCGFMTMIGATCTTLVTANGPGVYSTLNAGTTVPGADSYAADQGTSMATPHVAGVAALLFSAKPGLTPAQVKSYLQSSARPHPAGTTCATAPASGKCGAGLLDAAAALNMIFAPPTVNLTGAASRVVAPGTTVTLSGSASADPARVISSYTWSQASGASVGAISGANTANASFSAPATGTFSFTLTATDDIAKTGTATAIVRVNSAPVLTAVAAQGATAGGTISFNVGATDADGDTSIFHSISLPTGASLTAAGAFSWPNAGPAGAYTLTYYASDNDTNSSTGGVTIAVTAPVSAAAGGGGSLDDGALLALAFLAGCLRIRRALKGAAH